MSNELSKKDGVEVIWKYGLNPISVEERERGLQILRATRQFLGQAFEKMKL
jgi:hypothetical protein